MKWPTVVRAAHAAAPYVALLVALLGDPGCAALLLGALPAAPLPLVW